MSEKYFFKKQQDFCILRCNIVYCSRNKKTSEGALPKKMKECMYTYHYHRNRAIVRRNQTGPRVLFGIIGIAALYGVYCLSTLIRA